MIIRSRGEKIFSVFNHLFLVVLAAIMLLPFLHVLAKSLSDEAAVMAGYVGLVPIGFNLRTYKYVINNYEFLRSLYVSVVVTGVGTFLHVLITSLVAYPLSRDYLVGRGPITFIFIFTMLFSGGLIPTYLVVKGLGLVDTLGALIFPGIFSVFNMIILRNYFASIPDSLEEAAKIDGCSHLGIFFRIMLPLSMPAIATVCVYTAVGYWNNYFSALIYINSRNLYPLAMYLRQVVVDTSSQLVDLNPEISNLNPQSVRNATVIASTVPIIIVYPFLQKYFISGIMLGAVKE
ncbi:MAG: carbohydrate ABC transporter permease [Firmicutes bacterium]|nr:carbohydrate ABC transporter permease [Bacillota bacterium]